MPEKLNDPELWLFLWIAGAIWIARRSDLVFVRLACAAAAALPAGFFVYHYSRSLGAASAVALVLFVVLAFGLIVMAILLRKADRAIEQDREKGKGIDCSTEFQKRRRESRHKALPAFALIGIALLMLFWGSAYEYLAFFGFGTAVAWLSLICFLYYRCPNCGMIPISGGSSSGRGRIGFSYGVDLNPDYCCACGVRLRPEVRGETS